VHPRAHDPTLRREVRLRRAWRPIAAALILLAAFTASAFALAWSLTRTAPAWWTKPAPSTTTADPAARALALENGLVSVLSRPQPEGQPWTAAIHADDADAWLATRLPRWLAGQSPPVRLPPELAAVRVAFDGGAILIGAQINARGLDQILSARIVPRVEPSGALFAPASSLRVGRLILPASLVLNRRGTTSTLGSAFISESDLPQALRSLPQTDAVARALLGGIPLLRDARLKLADGRVIRLIRVDARDGQLLLTCTTSRGT
jgi:hypothetical protein